MDSSAISAVAKVVKAVEDESQVLHKIARTLVKRGATFDRVRSKELDVKAAIRNVVPQDKETTRRVTAHWKRFFGAFVAALPEDQRIDFKTTLAREKEERALAKASGKKRARLDA